MTRYTRHALPFLKSFTTVWLVSLALGTFLGWSLPWDWQNGSHTLAKTLAFVGGLVWVWVKRPDCYE